jgi:predicted alpha/beta-fold hydrolase
VAINHRGIVSDLSTPQLYACNNTSDLKESIEYVHQNFNGMGRKLMVIGVSLGANRMTNLLGELGETDLIDAACILSGPHKLWIATEASKTACDGFYDKALG